MAGSALTDALALLGHGATLTAEDSRAAVSEIIDGAAEPASIAAFLTALRLRGETAHDLVGAVRAVRDRMTPLEVPESCRPLLDTCGTGGDGANSVNVSTAAAIVVASCGVKVAKHGNRSASGNSGSAEVLTELGVAIEAEPPILLRCLEEVGITFLYAPRFHSALKHAAPVRRLLPFRTLFNLVGPLANPASPDFQLIGVPDRDRADLLARTMIELLGPSGRDVSAYVVAGGGGLDEVSLSGTNLARSVGSGPVGPQHGWTAEDFGLPITAIDSLRVSGPSESAAKIRAMLAGERGPVRDVVLANAAVALHLVRGRGSLAEGAETAAKAIDRGDSARLLERWAQASRGG